MTLNVQRFVTNTPLVVCLYLLASLPSLGQQATPSSSDHKAATPKQSNPAAACWQIVAYDSDNDPLFIGSAFAISDSLLATNAHVVRPTAEAIRKGGFVRVVQDETGMERHITRMWSHPGYDEEATIGPDVGVIEVSESLPSFLKLASGTMLHHLAVLDEIRLYGFPGDVARAIDIEQLLHGGLRPRATCLTGRITSLRPFVPSQNASPSNTLLIQHDAPATHGMSGSPVLNLRGEVVAIMSALTHDELGQNGFAIRSDVLDGLLRMVRLNVLPGLETLPDPNVSDDEPEQEPALVRLLDDTAVAVGGWPIALILCIGIVSLTFLQIARIRAKPQNQLILSLDHFAVGVQRRLTAIETQYGRIDGLTHNAHKERPDE